MMMRILRGRIVQSGRRHLSTKRMCLESHRLDKSMKRNDVLQLQVINNKKMIMISGLILMVQMMMKYHQSIVHKIYIGRSITDYYEAKFTEMDDEMLRQKCTSGDEHQYHIDQMKNFLQVTLFGKVERKFLSLYIHERPHLSFKANPHAKIFYIRKQKSLENQRKKFIRDILELGHEHKFVTEIVARRANECIVSITETDYKNLNKNDIEDMYFLIINGKVPDYTETGLLWSLSIFIKSLVIWERVHDFQLGIKSYQQKVNLTAPTMLGINLHMT
ncbi:hypothetical protein Tco_1527842 [Tanacetum coccineum]